MDSSDPRSIKLGSGSRFNGMRYAGWMWFTTARGVQLHKGGGLNGNADKITGPSGPWFSHASVKIGKFRKNRPVIFGFVYVC
jgi:hypothetical protein